MTQIGISTEFSPIMSLADFGNRSKDTPKKFASQGPLRLTKSLPSQAENSKYDSWWHGGLPYNKNKAHKIDKRLLYSLTDSLSCKISTLLLCDQTTTLFGAADGRNLESVPMSPSCTLKAIVKCMCVIAHARL